MSRYLAYDPQRLFDLRGAIDAAVWHIASTRFDHAFCEEFRTSVLGIRPRLEDLRDGVLQPVIDSDALEAFVAGAFAIAPIVVDGVVLDEPAEIREYLEANVPTEDNLEKYGTVIATMLGLSAPAAAAYWSGLSDEEKAAVIADRPDLARDALMGGATLTEGELRQLDAANAFAMFTQEFAVEFDAEVNLRWATVRVSDSYSVVAMKMSDGTVQVAIVHNSELAAGATEESADGTSASAVVGAFLSSGHVFVFPSEDEAEVALAELEEAIDGRDWTDAAVDGADLVLGPLYDDNSDFEDFVAETWNTYGAVRRDEGGVYGEVESSVKNQLAEAGIEARVSVSVYDTDTTDLSTEAARSGIIVAGTIGGHAETASGTGGSVSGEGSFVVDAYTTDGGDEYVTITVQGSASTGIVSELIGQAGIDADVQAEGGGQATITVTVPLTSDAVSGVVTALANGDVPAAVTDLYDSADITVSADVTLEVSAEVEADAEVVVLSVERTDTDTQNVITLHKLPDGEFYSQNELNGAVDEALGIDHIEALVVETYGPDAEVVYEGGEPAYVDTGGYCAPLPERD